MSSQEHHQHTGGDDNEDQTNDNSSNLHETSSSTSDASTSALDQSFEASLHSHLSVLHDSSGSVGEAHFGGDGFNLVASLQSQLEALTAQLDPPRAPNASRHDGGGNHQQSRGTSASGEAAGPDNEAVNTFLEFTGSTDRDRARRFLIAAGNQLEQAVNLFLSGTPLEMLEAPLRAARGRNQRTRTRGLGTNLLPTFQASVAGATGAPAAADERSPNSSESERSSWVYRMAGARNMGDMDSALLSMTGADISAMLGSGVQGYYSNGPLGSNKIMDDSQRAQAHIQALRTGIWDKAPEVGATCLRSPALVEMYLELGICKVIAAGLPMAICAGEDGFAVRLLQLLECIMRIVCDGHSACVAHCGWWFIPARRSGSRRLARNSFTEIFLERIVPENEVEGLRQLWDMENFDPSWRDRKTEAEMLACALHQGCSIEMLEVLVDPVNGCRANVNPDPDRLGSLPSPLLIAARGSGFGKLWKRQRATTTNHESTGDSTSRRDSEDSASGSLPSILRQPQRPDRRPFRLGRDASGEFIVRSEEDTQFERDPDFIEARERWSRQAVEILLDSGACVDEDVLDKLDSMTHAARELITAERAGTRVSERLQERAEAENRISEESIERWWKKDARRFFRALLRAVALTKHSSTMHRSMEVLGMMVKRFRPSPHSDAVTILDKLEYDRLLQLLQSMFTPENDDSTSLILIVDMTEALLERTQDENPGDLVESQEKYLGIHAQLCLSLCRYGIASRLRDLRSPGNPELEQAARKVVTHISTCIVDGLGLTEETLLGKSAALLDLCRRLREGDESVLEHLVWMMGQSRSRPASKKRRRRRRVMTRGLFGFDHSTQETNYGGDDDDEDEDLDDFDLDADLSDDDEAEDEHTTEEDEVEQPLSLPGSLDASESPLLRMYGEEGITPFEFEQSGLPSALLHFLLARDISESEEGESTAAEVRQARMHALLAAMPPPVVSKDVDEEDDRVDETGTPKNAQASTNTSGEGIHGDGEVVSGDDDDKRRDDERSDDGRHEEDVHTRERSLSNLGRQASMTLESVQNLATTTLESIDPPGVKNKVDASAFAASALFRLILKLQTVLSVHATHNFPVLAHDATASSGGVRALVNPIKIHLRRHPDLDNASAVYPDAHELVVQVLPLTPLQELQRQVLRGVRIVEPRYVAFCTRLVGRKVLHRKSSAHIGTTAGQESTSHHALATPASARRSPMMSPGYFGAGVSPRSPGFNPGAPGPTLGGEDFKVALVLRYDPITGAHLLQDMSARTLNKKSNKRWFILALREYQILERVFDSPHQGDAALKPVLSSLDEAVRNQDAGRSRVDSTSSTSAIRGAQFHEGDTVAVWWCGSDSLRPGWRRAQVETVYPAPINRFEGITPENAFDYDVKYLENHLLEDKVIRVGDRVKLIDDIAELERLAPGHGGFARDMPDYRGDIGRVVTVEGSDVKVDGLGNYTYNIKALIKVLADEGDFDTEQGDDSIEEIELRIPQRRLCSVNDVASYEERHVFSVYLVPSPNSIVARARADPQHFEQDSSSGGAVHKFKLNDRIEGRYAGKSRYYKGRIARVNADGTYDIAYDDGDSERGVKPNLVCHIGQGPGKVVSFDFRKVFPNAAGRALFDALRREDAVLQTEYNFVTRGFEHQPDFYSKFSQSLEDGGQGVFAQFQTRRQAEILYDRVQACGHLSRVRSASPSAAGTSSDKKDRVVTSRIDLLPDAPIPAVVERDIVSSFEHLRNRQHGRPARRNDTPPRPGHRAQVSLLPVDFLDPDTRREEEGPAEVVAARHVEPGRWISATIVAHRPAISEPASSQFDEANSIKDGDDQVDEKESQGTGQEDSDDSKPKLLLTCVLDDGRMVWDVPDTRARVAQRTSRVFPFKSKERQDVGASPTDDDDLGPVSLASKSRADPQEPVHLSRQFTAFGHSTSYKRIQFSQDADDADDEALGIQTFDDDDADSAFDGDADGYEDEDLFLGAPRITVDFLLRKRPKLARGGDNAEEGKSDSGKDSLPLVTFSRGNDDQNTNVQVPILAKQNMEISMFQALFELQNLHSAEEWDWVHWDQEYYLDWRVRCLFPGDPDYEFTQQRLLQRLPWGTPRALAFDVASNKELTLGVFVAALRPIVPDLRDWAMRNKLTDIVRYMEGAREPDSSSSDKRNERMVNWAAICAAYSQLCQRPLLSDDDTPMSPAVSPIRSPTLMRRDLLAMRVLGGSQGRMSTGSSPEGRQVPVAARVTDMIRGSSMPNATFASLADLTITDDNDDNDEGMEEVVTLLEECGIDASISGLRDTLMLLHLLYSHLVPFDEGADPLAAAFGKSLPWRSDPLSDLLLDQLSDPLAIATRCFPRWVALMPREFSFLFRRKVRELHFRTTALGVSRAVAWLQDEITGYNAKKKQLAHVTLEMSAMFKGVPDMVRFEQLQELSDRLEDEIRAIEQEHCIGQLHQDLVKVNRAELLRDAELLMKQHMHQRSELVVQFLDETGAGEGVTVDFYSSVSERLQLVDENQQIPLWANPAGSDKPVASTSSGASNKTGQANQDISDNGNTDGEDDTGDEAEDGDAAELHLLAPAGLFPQPLLPMGSVDGHGGTPRSLRPLSVMTNSSARARKGVTQDQSGAAGAVGIVDASPASDGDDDRKGSLALGLAAKVVLSEGKEDEATIKFDEDIESNRDSAEEVLRSAQTQNARVLRRFRFLGRIMAKALLDGMNVPLPLSPEFFMLIQQRQRGMQDALLPVSAISLLEGGSGLGDDSSAGDLSTQGSGGLVHRLYTLYEAGDMDAIGELLNVVELYFVDPAQRLAVLERAGFASKDSPSPKKTGARGGYSSSTSQETSSRSDGDSSSSGRNLAAEFEALAVPSKGSSPNELLAYAENASRLGKSQADIDAALANAGHAKLQRWKAIKASQKTRVQIGLARAERIEKRRAEIAVAAELLPGGSTRRVTRANVGEFLELVLTWWLGNGVAQQADAFCEGLRDVLGTTGRDALIFDFSHSELRRMLCGKEEILWKEEDPLLGCIVPMQGYTEHSPAIKMLVRCLKEMSMNERAQFLSFVTAQPRVPLSGLPQIKVYPPLMECIPAVVVRLQNERDRSFEVGDSVTLSSDYRSYDDASDGPLRPGEVSFVTNVDGRIRVAEWWYSPRALTLICTSDGRYASSFHSSDYLASSVENRASWFKPGDSIRTAKVRGKVSEWDPETWTLTFDSSVDMDTRRGFKAGQSIERVPRSNSSSSVDDENSSAEVEDSKMPNLCVDHLVEQPQAIQMRPYLRPKATTCAKTLYLPNDYDSWQHMLETFKNGAFQDAKLGGIHEDARS